MVLFFVFEKERVEILIKRCDAWFKFTRRSQEEQHVIHEPEECLKNVEDHNQLHVAWPRLEPTTASVVVEATQKLIVFFNLLQPLLMSF